MSLNSSVNSTDSDVFYVEQLSDEPSPRKNNTPDILNSTARTHHQAMRMPSVSTIASPQPHFVTIDDDSNQITIPYGFGQQHPIVPPSLNDLNLPPNPFNILATMAIANNTGDDNNAYSTESPDPSLPSSISSPPMSVSALHSFETTHSTTDDNTFYYSSDNDPRRICWETSLNETFESNEPRRVSYRKPSIHTAAAAAPKTEKKVEPGNVLSKRGGSVAAHLRSLRADNPSSKGHPRPIN